MWFIYTMMTVMMEILKPGTTCQYTMHPNLLMDLEGQIGEGVEEEGRITEGGDEGGNRTIEEQHQGEILEGGEEADVTLDVKVQTVVKAVTVDTGTE
jgi:hypothetical protein